MGREGGRGEEEDAVAMSGGDVVARGGGGGGGATDDARRAGVGRCNDTEGGGRQRQATRGQGAVDGMNESGMCMLMNMIFCSFLLSCYVT